MTIRERVLQALRENPEGLSRRRLHELVECNLGTLRQQINSLESAGLINVTTEERDYGPTKVHRLGRAQIVGQTSFQDGAA